MNILVTGGLGVNGVRVVRKLLERGYQPIVYENRTDFSLIRDLEGHFEVVRGDINDLATLIRTLLEHKIRRVVHMAALMPPDAQSNLLQGFRVNALGTVQVLEASRIAGVERVVFTSSRAAYGHIPEGEYGHPGYRPIPEDHPCNPRTVYDVTKLASEGMGLNYQREYGLQFVALRFASIFGPGKLARHGAVSIHGQIIEHALARRPFHIARGREQRDDIVYVDDVAEGIVLATLKDRLAYSVYNVGSGQLHSLVEFADAVREFVPEAQIEIGPGLDYLGMGVNYYGLLDITRARADLDFSPKYNLRDGIRDYIETMRRLHLQPLTA